MIGAEERQRVLQKYDDGNWRRDPTTNSWGRVPQFISHRSATGHGHTVEEAKRGQLERKYVWVTADGYPFGSEEPPPPPPLEEERRKLVAAVPSAPPLELKLTHRLHGRDERLADTSARIQIWLLRQGRSTPAVSIGLFYALRDGAAAGWG